MTKPEKLREIMPDKIYACPRGSGTVSGVWTDNECGDEPETPYIRQASVVVPEGLALAITKATMEWAGWKPEDMNEFQWSEFEKEHGPFYAAARELLRLKGV